MVDIERFLSLSNRLKCVKRRGWMVKVGVSNTYAESVADHAFMTTLACMILADLKGINAEKTIRMALLHDLAESIIGDHTPEDIEEGEKHKREDNAMKELLALLPDQIRDHYMLIWNEYLQNASNESKFVHQIDKLEMAIQASHYREKGYDKDKLEEFFDSASRQIYDELLLKILNSLK